MNKEKTVDKFVDLKSQVRKMPQAPGVYLMRDRDSQVIYVGKAKDIRSRVRSYFSGADERSQIEFLLERIETIETIVTGTETQAFILERDLITKYKPRYNVRLKDDREYLSLRIDRSAVWPRFELVRRPQADGADYFGPYSFSYELKRILELVRRVVPLRTCTDTVFHNRQRPCLEYQIKRCAGPCCLPVDRDQYKEWVKQAIAIVEGRSASLKNVLEKEMNDASADLRFEEAAIIRDRIGALKNAKENNQYLSSIDGSDDVINFFRQEQCVAMTVLRVRGGRIRESSNYSFENVLVTDQEFLDQACTQYYQEDREIADRIVLPFEIESSEPLVETIQARFGRKVEVIAPQRGVKLRLLNLAKLNAQQHYASVFEEQSKALDVAKELARICQLKQVPRRIECVDISNLQSWDIVGASVVFFDGSPMRDQYRKYNITGQDKPDDFAAVFEVVHRRLERAKTEGDFPDLLVIDGGPVQLAKAIEARDAHGVAVDIISLAKIKTATGGRSRGGAFIKKPERIFLEGQEKPIELSVGQPVTSFLQRLRDEAHRFVITFHRKKRGKRVFASALDGILGVGPDRRRRLLKAYDSVEAMRKAAPEELAKAGRMPKPLADKILRHLNQREG